MVMTTPRRLSSSIDDIRQRVDRRAPHFLALKQRMVEDQNLWRLIQDLTDDNLIDENRRYTTNEPRVFANKLYRTVATAALNIRIPVHREQESRRQANQAAKDFLKSALKMADERLTDFLQPELQDQLAFYATVRGWYAGRVLMRIDYEQEKTYVDITPWDPMNVVWEIGPNGLLWICNMSYKTRHEIMATHPNVSFSDDELEAEDRLLVYDYYDARDNVVFADALDIKDRTRHGSPRVPAFIGYVGGEPMMANSEWNNGLADVGESCFQSVRHLYGHKSAVMSAQIMLVERSIKNPVVIKSVSGQKTLQSSPYKAGAEIPIRQGEEVEALALPQLAKETNEFLTLLNGEIQRGSLPFSTYGETPFQLSGYAIQTLRQGIESQITPIIKGLRVAYLQITRLLKEQYGMGYFPPLEVPGEMDMANAMLVAESDKADIMLRPSLPQDVATMVQMAQMAREGPNDIPLVPDAYARSEWLHIQDEEEMQDLINEQIGQRLVPTAMLKVIMDSLVDRGQQELAMEYLMQYIIERNKSQLQMQVLMMQAQGLIPPGGMGGQGAGQGGGEGQGQVPGRNTEFGQGQVPQEALGNGPPRPQGNTGGFVAPGTPRPRARRNPQQMIP